MSVIPAVPHERRAFDLLLQGSQALSQVETNGFRIDTAYLERAIAWSEETLKGLYDDLRKDEFWSDWKKSYGTGANMQSRKQFGEMLFDVRGYECRNYTGDDTSENRRAKTDPESLSHIDLPFIKKWESWQQLTKCNSTFLKGILAEVDDRGYLHPVFNLHCVSTYRSSSDSPNFQNFPARNKRLSRLVRRAFIPRDSHVLCEVDFGALEFRGAACFWRDPAMLEYAADMSLDIHRDMAAEVFGVSRDQVSSMARTMTKNGFVFPILYGSWYKSCAVALWEAIAKMGIKTVDGVCLYDHLLTDHGIRNLDDYTEHVRKVEERFNNKFSHWSSEKEKWWNLYLKRGWFPLMTGFVCKGEYSRNNLMNTPIQGPSFHLLLWSLAQLQNWLVSKNMRSKIVGQIHDSIVLDIHESELDDVLNMAHQIMTVSVREHWDWVQVPLIVEAEVATGTWFDKREYIDDGSGHWIAKQVA